MSRLLSNRKAITVLVLLAALFILGLAGGALGEEFGGGFLGSPLAHIQLPAEHIHADLGITNTMVATWVTILFLALLAFFGTRRLKEVPGRLQNALEVVLEFFLSLAESVAGA